MVYTDLSLILWASSSSIIINDKNRDVKIKLIQFSALANMIRAGHNTILLTFIIL
jgi:hypothetical protein